MRESFVFMKQWWEGIEALPPKDIAEAITAIMNYALKGEVYSGTNLAVVLLMGMVKAQIDDNNARYQEICEKRKKAIESRWKKVSDESDSIQENTNVSTSIQVRTDSDSDSDSDSGGVYDSDNDRENKRKRFRKPTYEEVERYCRERNNGIDAHSFVDYYESKDWKIGKSKMKDWKAAIRTWESKRKETQPKTEPNLFRPDMSEADKRQFQQKVERDNEDYNNFMAQYFKK